jgi:hypothetical protein
VPLRPAQHRRLRGGAAVVAGPGEQLTHDRGCSRHGFSGQLGLNGPALPGVGEGAAVREMNLPVGYVLAEADPPADPRAQPPLAAPVRLGLPVAGRRLQGQPDHGDRADVREPGQRGRHRGVAQPARGQPAPGQPRPGRPGAEPGHVGVAEPPPAGHQPPRAVLAQIQQPGQQVELQPVHLRDEQQPAQVPLGELDRARPAVAGRADRHETTTSRQRACLFTGREYVLRAGPGLGHNQSVARVRRAARCGCAASSRDVLGLNEPGRGPPP